MGKDSPSAHAELGHALVRIDSGLPCQVGDQEFSRFSCSNEFSWDPALLKSIALLGGNKKINERLEPELPHFYRRPWPGLRCPHAIRSAFVESKYDFEEFMEDAALHGRQWRYSGPTKSVTLYKKLKKTNKFVERRFELWFNHGEMKYFIQPGDTEPKSTIKVKDIDVAWIDSVDLDAPADVCLMFSFLKNDAFRFIFISSPIRGLMVEWYNAIRNAKCHVGSQDQLIGNVTNDVTISGWLEKSGPKSTDLWRKRWCMLVGYNFLYMEQPSSPYTSGYIQIRRPNQSVAVLLDYTPSGRRNVNKFYFTLRTPARDYGFSVTTEEQRNAWVNALNDIIVTGEIF
ncbi:unnamed protein product [Protopolystoma xenopodis]|uniref:PH domain-containing protein n=1 Tax=Protopolystoma xenopodis TaxID=117903 RepID=A0A3S5B115_9PLAT|nr:unnamed protein product [Protopolystoma xenopodis]